MGNTDSRKEATSYKRVMKPSLTYIKCDYLTIRLQLGSGLNIDSFNSSAQKYHMSSGHCDSDKETTNLER